MSNLKHFRKEHKLTGAQAAALLGYGYQSWVSYENGRRNVPKHLLKHIERYNDLRSIYKKMDHGCIDAYCKLCD